MSTGITVETAYVDLRVRLEKLDADLKLARDRIEKSVKSVETSVNKTGTSFAKVGTVLRQLAPLIGATFGVQAINNAIDYASSLKDVSDQLGVNVEEFQRLRFAFTQSGVSAEAFTTAFTKFARGLGQANQESNNLGELLEKLGISADKSRDELELFQETLFKIAELPGAEKFTAAATAFGRGGTVLLGVARQGQIAFNQLKASADELGIVIDKDTVNALEEFGDKLDVLKAVGTAELSKAIEALLPVFQLLTKALSASAQGIGFWVDAIRQALEDVGAIDPVGIDRISSRLARIRERLGELNRIEKERLRVNKGAFGLDPVETRQRQDLLKERVELQKQLQEGIRGEAAARALLQSQGLDSERAAVKEQELKAEQIINTLLAERLAMEGDIVGELERRTVLQKNEIDQLLSKNEITGTQAELLKAEIDTNATIERRLLILDQEHARQERVLDIKHRLEDFETRSLERAAREKDRLSKEGFEGGDETTGINRAEEAFEIREALLRRETDRAKELAEQRARILIESRETTAKEEIEIVEKLNEELELLEEEHQEKVRELRAEADSQIDDQVTTFGERMGEVFRGLDEQIASSFGAWLRTGEDVFTSLGNAFIEEVSEVIIQELVKVALELAKLGITKAATAAGVSIPGLGAPLAAGGIVTRPGIHLLGESGPEAVIPLNQVGGSIGKTVVQVFNSTGQAVTVREKTGMGNDPHTLKILVGDLVVENIERGGSISQAMERRYGATRRGF